MTHKDNEDILNHPHSRFVASTNYVQHYSGQYENEIVSKSEEFDNFFIKYREVKEDEKAFSNLINAFKEIKFDNYPINKLNSGFGALTDIHEKKGTLTENYDFLSKTLNIINNYNFNNNTKLNELNNQKSSKGFDLEQQINNFKTKIDKYMTDIIQKENDSQQSVLDQVDMQILEAKRQQNSDLSNY